MRLGKSVWIALVLPVLVLVPAVAQSAEEAAKAAKRAPTPSAVPAGASASAAAAAPAASSGAGTGAPIGVGAAIAASAGPAGATPRPSSSAVDGAAYTVRLRDLEQRIDELKEQIRRSHTRLSLLTDTILSGGAAGSRADVEFSNEMSSAFRLTRALFVLDGAVQYNKSDDSGALAEQSHIPVFTGSIPPGDHTLAVLLQFQGYGYGVFSYLRGYHFEVKTTHSFTAVDGKTLNLEVVAYEKGGVTTPLEERPAVRFSEKVTAGLSQGAAPPASKAAPAGQGASPAAGSPAAGVSTSFTLGTGGK